MNDDISKQNLTLDLITILKRYSTREVLVGLSELFEDSKRFGKIPEDKFQEYYCGTIADSLMDLVRDIDNLIEMSKDKQS